MNIIFKPLLRLTCALIASANGAWAQSAQQQGITSTTQVLDTSVLFAIGAREAEQAIRGSFGWPTFQEGFVDRVYFRFDPDGYARFSTSPRLDEDVFEVICAESSTACIAKKPSLEIGLTVEGKVQIRIADVAPQDSFFVSDRKSELPLPPTILEPLDPRLETLLASGGRLVVKRELETIQEISLAGFSAVATYLRWIAQGQSPRVFPRGWPVPAQVEAQQIGSLTQPSTWIAPSAGPQQVQTTFAQANRQQGFQNRNFGNPQGNLGQQQIPYGNSFGVDNNQGGFDSPDQSRFNGQVTQRFGADQRQGSDAQAAIQALQLELAQLRSSQSQNEASSAAQIQDDFAIGFAQQAQARNLPLSDGYGVALDVPVGSLRGGVFGAGSETQVDQTLLSSTPTQPLFASYMQGLDARIYALEQAVNEMRSVFVSEMNSLKWPQAGAVQVNASLAQSAEPIAVPEEPASMDALEKLLLERLAQRDAIASPMAPAVNVSTPAPQGADRTLVMDLLKQLEQGQEPSVLDEAPLASSMEQPADVEPGGFVTLSDYINQMLKSEGSGKPDPN
tara:strand:- start:23331 stop:25016 length:1686 start_codon:yes stop_codon:yes gene_type:complete